MKKGWLLALPGAAIIMVGSIYFVAYGDTFQRLMALSIFWLFLLETIAIIRRRPGDTITELTVATFGVKSWRKPDGQIAVWSVVRTVALWAFLFWFVVHLITGGAF